MANHTIFANTIQLKTVHGSTILNSALEIWVEEFTAIPSEAEWNLSVRAGVDGQMITNKHEKKSVSVHVAVLQMSLLDLVVRLYDTVYLAAVRESFHRSTGPEMKHSNMVAMTDGKNCK